MSAYVRADPFFVRASSIVFSTFMLDQLSVGIEKKTFLFLSFIHLLVDFENVKSLSTGDVKVLHSACFVTYSCHPTGDIEYCYEVQGVCHNL